jgi:alpha-galactosidase
VPIALLADHVLGDTVARYEHDPVSGVVALSLLPRTRFGDVVPRRARLEEPEVLEMPAPWCDAPARRLDSLVQIQCAIDERPGGYAQGRTLRNGGTTLALRLEGQETVPGTAADGGEPAREIVTRLQGPHDLRVVHHLRWTPGEPALTVWVEVENQGSRSVHIESLSSFSLDGITPFHRADAPGRLWLHRFRGGWSSEGRLESAPVESLHLERGWQGHSVNVERFGQVGSLPSRGFFPCAVVEDIAAKVTWAAQLVWPGSWQMEVYRQGDCLAFSGGLADREFGHWVKRLAAGARMESPRALVTVADGGLDEVCDRLILARERALPAPPAGEESLPVVFNEFCTSWGDPRPEGILAAAERLRGTAVKYFVIDAGWYADLGRLWFSAHGDWTPGRDRFPAGIAAVADQLRARGFVPGLWFEWETCGRDSETFREESLLLRRDGVPVTVSDRRFLDLRQPAVRERLRSRVLDLLAAGGFGYVKFDYNETLGLGVDGTESPGEGLRQVMLATGELYAEVRRRLPDLVVELCASGGHRLEPSLLAEAHMGSFSDAHETPELPIIAAGLHRLVPVRQLQVWVVLRPTANERRLRYALASGFLGRMCLSGDVCGLSAAHWGETRAALSLYAEAAPLLRDGVTRRFGPPVPAWRHPTGWQVVFRSARDRSRLLVVAHAFADDVPSEVDLELPAGEWRVRGELGGAIGVVSRGAGSASPMPGEISRSGGVAALRPETLVAKRILWRPDGAFSAAVALLERAG